MLSNGEIYYGSWLTSLVCERGTAQMMLSLEGEYKCTAVHAIGQDAECYVDLRRNTVRISEKGRLIRMDNLHDAWKTTGAVLGGSLANFRDYTLGALGFRPTFELQNISMLASIGAFYRALIAGRPVPVGSAEGTAVVQGCEKIIENARCFIENGVGHAVQR